MLKRHFAQVATLLLAAFATSIFLSSCASVPAQGPNRSPGELVDDSRLQSQVERAVLRTLGQRRDERVRVTVFNGKVLLTGQVATNERASDAGLAALRIQHVRSVENQLTTEPVRTLPGRLADSRIAVAVRNELAEVNQNYGNQMKVVVEKGAVYLLGVATRAEGAAFVQQARFVRGVKKVVVVFDYVD